VSTLSISHVSFELGQFLRRAVWQPFRWMMGIFHPLPAAAAAILLVLLVYVGQTRELYLSYLEAPNGVHIIYALAGFALISAAFYQAHYRLNTMRINVVYSHLSQPNTGINLLRLQRVAGFIWAFSPWAGLAMGLFLTEGYLRATYRQLCSAGVSPSDITKLLTLPAVNSWTILSCIILLGAVVGVLFAHCRESRVVRFVVVLLMPTAAALVFILLAGSRSINAGALTMLVTGVFAIFYGVYYLLDTKKIGPAYSAFYVNSGIDVERRRRLLTLVWALAPWFFIALYFLASALAPAQQTGAPSFACSADALAKANAWPIVDVAIIGVVAIGLLVAVVMDRFGRRPEAGFIVAAAVVVAVLVVVAVAASGPGALVGLRVIGPFAAMAASLVFIFSVLAALAMLSQRSGLPALTLIVAAIVLGMVFNLSIDQTAWWSLWAALALAVLALVARLGYVAAVATALCFLALLTIWRDQQHIIDAHDLKMSDTSIRDVEDTFDEWVRGRHDRAPGKGDPAKPYPAFIISTEGGGIYAAAAASLFLAKLQDDCPGFAQHVFAISGVSGGAIGAAVFQAHVPPSEQKDKVACRALTDDGPLTQTMTRIMERDHFSPVVAAVIPDILGERAGRSEALEASFAAVDDRAVRARLQQPFPDHWSNGSAAPSLVLNATWAETGYRVAFAPFLLHTSPSSDGTFYSFADADMPGENRIPLMQAAVVSARFPGILPPLTIKMSNDRWWNFVDGGYADSSGAATALALFKALQDTSCGLNVDLKLILLTSTNPQPNFQNVTGSEFRDTMAPIQTVMNVRELLGSQAVTRTSEYFKRTSSENFKKASPENLKKTSPENFKSTSPCDEMTAPDWQLEEIKLADREYSLPLGWKLSNTTLQLVSFLIGRPAPCRTDTLQEGGGALDASAPQPPPKGGALTEQKALQNNSCVMDKVERLFDKPQ
jgi:hypothetical protein